MGRKYLDIAHEVAQDIKNKYHLPFTIWKFERRLRLQIKEVDDSAVEEMIILMSESTYGAMREPSWIARSITNNADILKKYTSPKKHLMTGTKYCIT
jgi:hypothetical protein